MRVLRSPPDCTVAESGSRAISRPSPGRRSPGSTIVPLTAASPFFRTVDLAARGVELIHPDAPVAHALAPDRAVVLERSVAGTAAGFGDAHDARAWRRLFGPLTRDAGVLSHELLRPVIHVPRHPLALARFGLPALRSTAELYDPWPNGVLFGRRFDLGTFPWRTGIAPPCDLYMTSAIPRDQNPGGANNTGYSRPEFDAACQAATTALDEADRRASHMEAQRLFAEDVPSLPLFFRPKAGAAVPDVAGFQLDSTTASVLWNVEVLALP